MNLTQLSSFLFFFQETMTVSEMTISFDLSINARPRLLNEQYNHFEYFYTKPALAVSLQKDSTTGLKVSAFGFYIENVPFRSGCRCLLDVVYSVCSEAVLVLLPLDLLLVSPC